MSKRKIYEKPAMLVLKLQHQTALLTVSNPDAISGENFIWDED